MAKLGFQQQWIERIMMCVTSVSYKVRVNGELTDVIVPQRGLRQGDPLSPYLFLFCVEGFSALLKHAQQEREVKGVTFGSTGPHVTHLLFADDSLLMFKSSVEGAVAISDLLECYCLASG